MINGKKNEINVEMIMTQIRENIKRKRDITNLVNQSKVSESENIERAQQYLNSNCDIRNMSYFISSHRPILGPILIKGREMVHGEVNRFLDPIIWKQKEFNENIVIILNDILHRLNETKFKLDQMTIDIKSDLEKTIDEKVGLAINSLDIEKIIEGKVEDAINVRDIEKTIDEKVGLAIAKTLYPKQIEGMNYVAFEDKFRSSRDNIKQRQSIFVQFFEQCNNVLDIGCGRGEFIELLKNNGIGAHGIDINDDMVKYCESMNLNVEKIDGLLYLETIEDESLDGIFMDQVIEHLEPNYISKMLTLCYQKMIHGHYVVIETINLLSLASFVNFFYMDLTHNKPLHPETLKFLLESVGFRDIDIKFLSPFPESAKLKKMETYDDMNEKDKKLLDAYNYNIEKLNNTLFGAQDYVIIGKK